MPKRKEELMSIYLFDEQPIIANKTLARELGLNEALVLQQINYWIEINKKSGKNFYDGRYWTYNSIRAWQENDFDYLSVDTVKRTFVKLESQGFLLVGNYNKDPRDKTKWYTIKEERHEELYQEIEEKKLKRQKEALKENYESAENTVLNVLGQNAPMDWGKMHQCNSAESTNGFVQNLPMQNGKMHQPLPEITTNISSDISTKTSTHQPIRTKQTRDGMVERSQNKKSYESCLEELSEQTGYNEHKSLGNTNMLDRYEKILSVLTDVMILDDDELVNINQTKMKARIVQERYRMLGQFHIDYLWEILQDHEYEIKNIRAFILTAAYNAPSNMEAYYKSKTSYDMRNYFGEV